ncbi:hypothetical protein D5086_009643 [Populus alba]|uniref:Uncharacterized protein n=1 Tax=Populus alba TaxID=43335 RepID=A0ACC4C8S8_POPAL
MNEKKPISLMNRIRERSKRRIRKSNSDVELLLKRQRFYFRGFKSVNHQKVVELSNGKKSAAKWKGKSWAEVGKTLPPSCTDMMEMNIYSVPPEFSTSPKAVRSIYLSLARALTLKNASASNDVGSSNTLNDVGYVSKSNDVAAQDFWH